jgi:hypothetical protein
MMRFAVRPLGPLATAIELGLMDLFVDWTANEAMRALCEAAPRPLPSSACRHPLTTRPTVTPLPARVHATSDPHATAAGAVIAGSGPGSEHAASGATAG